MYIVHRHATTMNIYIYIYILYVFVCVFLCVASASANANESVRRAAITTTTTITNKRTCGPLSRMRRVLGLDGKIGSAHIKHSFVLCVEHKAKRNETKEKIYYSLSVSYVHDVAVCLCMHCNIFRFLCICFWPGIAYTRITKRTHSWALLLRGQLLTVSTKSTHTHMKRANRVNRTPSTIALLKQCQESWV